MATCFDEMKANRAIMPKRLSPMFARLSLHRAKCAIIDSGTRKPLSVPECQNTIDSGTGTAAWILRQAKRLAITLASIPIFK